MARVQSIVKKNSFCCPNCQFEIFSLLGHYHHHGIKIDAGTVTTPLGTVHLTHGQQVILLGLLETYPKPMTRSAMVAYYEFYLESVYGMEHQPDNIGNSIDVQLVKIRRTIGPIGLDIRTLWGNGWRVEFTFEALDVSIPA